MSEILGMERLCWDAKQVLLLRGINEKINLECASFYYLLVVQCSSSPKWTRKKALSLYFKDRPKEIKAKRFGFTSESGALLLLYIWKAAAITNLTCIRLWWCLSDERKKCFWKSYIIEVKIFTFAFIMKLVKIGLLTW